MVNKICVDTSAYMPTGVEMKLFTLSRIFGHEGGVRAKATHCPHQTMLILRLLCASSHSS
jgi:hypothetical protein